MLRHGVGALVHHFAEGGGLAGNGVRDIRLGADFACRGSRSTRGGGSRRKVGLLPGRARRLRAPRICRAGIVHGHVEVQVFTQGRATSMSGTLPSEAAVCGFKSGSMESKMLLQPTNSVPLRRTYVEGGAHFPGVPLRGGARAWSPTQCMLALATTTEAAARLRARNAWQSLALYSNEAAERLAAASIANCSRAWRSSAARVCMLRFARWAVSRSGSQVPRPKTHGLCE